MRPHSVMASGLALLVAGCSASVLPSSQPARDTAVSAGESGEPAPSPAPAATDEPDRAEPRPEPEQAAASVAAPAEEDPTPATPPGPEAPLPSIEGVVIEAMTKAGEGARWTTSLGSDGCFETKGGGGRGDGSTATSEDRGCIGDQGAADWLREAAEIARGAGRVSPPAKEPTWRAMSESRVILLDKDGTRWEPAEEAAKQQLGKHARKLFDVIETLQVPQAGPPTSKGWRLVTVWVESANGESHFAGSLSSSGQWHCESARATGARNPYERRQTRLGVLHADKAAAALDRILRQMRPAKEYEEQPEGGVRRQVEAQREAEPTSVTATRGSTAAVIEAWRSEMGRRASVCAATGVGGR